MPAPRDYATVLEVLIAALCVIYWRITLRVAAIVIIVVLILGAVAIIHGIYHLVV